MSENKPNVFLITILNQLVANINKGIVKRLIIVNLQSVYIITDIIIINFKISEIIANKPCAKISAIVSMSETTLVTNIPTGVLSKKENLKDKICLYKFSHFHP